MPRFFRKPIELPATGVAAGLAAGLLLLANPAAAQLIPDTCPSNLNTTSLIEHDLSASFCELCEVGTVRLVIENPYRASDDVDFTAIVVTENLQDSGLTYVPGTTSFTGSNITPPLPVEPVVTDTNGRLLTWTLPAGFTMDAPSGLVGNTPRLTIEFDVRRAAAPGEEGLVSADRDINASVEFAPSCDLTYRHSDETGNDPLPLREPEPVIVKTGRNVDAGQGAASYSDPVYGHENDDVIWRIEVVNNGEADLQDFRFDDVMDPGNYVIDYICDSEADANSAATNNGTGDCQATGGVTTLNDVSVAALFGGGANPYIVAPAGGNGFYYLVGRVTDSCSNHTNTVSDVQWGCQVEAPPGGISQTSGLLTAGDDALLSTLSLANTLDVAVALTGTNTSQPMGGKGTVTITISNNTGGTIIGGAGGFRLRNVLPAEYVVDPTFDPVVSMAPAYGNDYPGMLDTISWDNPVAGTYPTLSTTDPLVPLQNTAPEFTITSSDPHPDFPLDHVDMLRHGDVLTITFRTVLIDPSYYDREAYIDVQVERPGSDPPNTDPTESFAIANELEIWYEEFCTNTEYNRTFNDNDTADPEDIDLGMIGSPLVYILTNTDVLPLRVDLNNNGGHDADDYFAYVTFGEAMTVQTAPASCSATSNPPAWPEWQLPVGIPSTATVYQCDPGVVPAGGQQSLEFEVVKNTDASADDDLTFRADVIGEITLSDGTPLWFPTPYRRAAMASCTDRANNYSIDSLRARVIGYNLTEGASAAPVQREQPAAEQRPIVESTDRRGM